MGFIDELRKLSKPYAEDDDFDDDDLDEDEPAPRRARPSRSSSAPAPAPAPAPLYNYDELGIGEAASGNSQQNSKVVNIHTTAQLQVVIVSPDRFDNILEIAEQLREKHAVLLNLEKTDKNVARRIVDFLSGCAYALDGKIKKAAISTYIITPFNVDIVGDLVDELESNGMYL